LKSSAGLRDRGRGGWKVFIVKQNEAYLDGKCLVAMPALQGNIFARSVVYICAHSEDGAMGLIVNHPADGVNFVDLLLQLKVIEAEEKSSLDGRAGATRVLTGGPVDSSRGFVLHSRDYHAEQATMEIDESVAMTATLDVLRAIAQGRGPKDAFLALGYASWSPGQLEQEILANSWMICPADELLLFDRDYDSKYARALGAIGVNLGFLSDEAGHA
jgi:putative transcriptional regulator